MEGVGDDLFIGRAEQGGEGKRWPAGEPQGRPLMALGVGAASQSGGASGEAGTGRRDRSGRASGAASISRRVEHRNARAACGHRRSVSGQGAGRRKKGEGKKKKKKRKRRKGKRGKGRERKRGAGGIRGAGREPGVVSTGSGAHEERREQEKFKR